MPMAEHLKMLRAMIEGDFDRHQEISNRLQAEGSLDEYGIVIGAASFIAIRKQFESKRGYSPEDVIQLVADARIMFDLSGDVIDPRVAELVIRTALSESGLLDGVPAAKVVEAQMIICSYLSATEKLGNPDEFMHEAESLIDEWSARRKG